MCSFAIDWKSSEHGNVCGEYLFSWLGITGHALEDALFEELSAHGIKRSDVILSYQKQEGEIDQHPLSKDPPSGHVEDQKLRTASIEEIRIGIIRCDDRTIIFNLLEKAKK